MSGRTLFMNGDTYEIDHTPEQLLYRKTHLRELAFNVRPGSMRKRTRQIINLFNEYNPHFT